MVNRTTLIYADNLCIPQKNYDHYMQLLDSLGPEIRKLLIQIAWNPRTPLVSQASRNTLKEAKLLDDRYQLETTFRELIKVYFDRNTYMWRDVRVRKDIVSNSPIK
ncbi:MAG: hypothetical protein JSS32_03415 [Verrucomicrobia bacterium]|nr:hypothetical protein [Verrucomicrobiota bacterium]